MPPVTALHCYIDTIVSHFSSLLVSAVKMSCPQYLFAYGFAEMKTCRKRMDTKKYGDIEDDSKIVVSN